MVFSDSISLIGSPPINFALERKKNKKSFQDLDRKTASHMGSLCQLEWQQQGGTKARWKFNRVDGFNAIAERKRRFGLIQSEQNPAINRSKARRLGARPRQRFTIRS
jgi:hypothetical protein